jgi:siroheme synthase
MRKGIVYLVGAGPGDPGLLTIRGLKVLRQAEVVIYDRLVNPVLLAEAPAQALRISAAKLPGHHSPHGRSSPIRHCEPTAKQSTRSLARGLLPPRGTPGNAPEVIPPTM